eukprot:c19028_g1_i1.p1 GENE.c19028_g1_i1~~c19028_g1_i1.p1  ORF type:complete len:169 (+),score=12.31 c19028_g1_i1:2-508(+)
MGPYAWVGSCGPVRGDARSGWGSTGKKRSRSLCGSFKWIRIRRGRWLRQSTESRRLRGAWKGQKREYCPAIQFGGIFLPQKQVLLELLDDFEQKRGVRQASGFPHKLGLLLHGPSGTGKTSLVKAIAHRMKQHIVSIPLQRISPTHELRVRGVGRTDERADGSGAVCA